MERNWAVVMVAMANKGSTRIENPLLRDGANNFSCGS
jgi:hypothetical protein